MDDFERAGREVWVHIVGLALFIALLVAGTHVTVLRYVFIVLASIVAFGVGLTLLVVIAAMIWAVIAPLIRWLR